MATGDILSATVVDKTTSGLGTDGTYLDIEIEGFVDGGAYDFGLGANNDPSSAKVVLTVVSEGYTGTTLGTITRTIYGTQEVRQAYPNEAFNDEVESGGNVTVRIALSENIYNDDKDGGAGTSGTNPTVTIASGFYVNSGTGGGSESSNAVTDLAVTNDSTLDYPKAIASWDMIGGAMDGDRVKSSFNMSAIAFHGHGISAVRFDADGQGSSNNETETVTAQSAEQYSLTGHYRTIYKTAAIALTNFNQAELIDLRFRAYPKVGDADSVWDTDSNTTAGQEARAGNQAAILCDKSDALDVFAVVDDTLGNDGTAVASATLATAEASPYLTLAAAVASSANLIYLEEGTHDLGSSQTRVTTNEWKRILPHPTNSIKANTFVRETATKPYRCERLSIEGVTYRRETSSSWLDGETLNYLRYKDTTFDRNSVGTTVAGPGYKSLTTYVQECDGDLSASNWNLNFLSTAHVAYSFEGNDCDSGAGGLGNAGFNFAGNSCATLYRETASGNPAGDNGNNVVVAFNSCVDVAAGSSNIIELGETTTQHGTADGIAIVQNLIETSSGTQAIFYIFGDSSVETSNNVLVMHNTVYGERMNIAYNDTGSTAIPRTNFFQIGNIFEEWNTKADLDPPENGNRTGSWPVSYNVNTRGCFHLSNASAAFRGEFDGIDVVFAGTIDFVDDASTNTGTGLGNGDYHIGASSDAIGLVSSPLLDFDLEGNLRNSSATAAGVYRHSSEAKAYFDFGAAVIPNGDFILGIRFKPDDFADEQNLLSQGSGVTVRTSLAGVENASISISGVGSIDPGVLDTSAQTLILERNGSDWSAWLDNGVYASPDATINGTHTYDGSNFQLGDPVLGFNGTLYGCTVIQSSGESAFDAVKAAADSW